MTHEEFNAKFQILNQIADGSVRSYHALSSSGAVVMAHFLAEEPSAESSAILARLDTLEPERKGRVVKITDVDGAPVVVTKFILDFESLQHWLELDTAPLHEASSATTEPAPPAEPAEPIEPAEPAEPEEPPEPAAVEATATPEVSAVDADTARPIEPAATTPDPDPAPVPSSAPAPDPEPGEFTRIFQAATPGPTNGPETEAPPGPAAAPKAQAEAAPEVGEFTRLFQTPLPVTPTTAPEPTASLTGSPDEPPREAPAAPPPPAPAAKLPDVPPAAAGAGEFTQLFQATAPSEAAPPQEAAAQPAPVMPLDPASREPGEFTRIFQSPLAAEAPAPSPAGPSATEPAGQVEEPRGGSAPPTPPPAVAAQRVSGREAAPHREPSPSVGKMAGRIDDAADVVDVAADLRLPEQRKLDLPSASPSLPGLNLHSSRSAPPAGFQPAAVPGTPSPDPAKPSGGEFTRIFGRTSAPESQSSQPPGLPSAPPLGQAPGIGEVARQARDAHGYAERLQGMGQRSQPAAPAGPPPLAAAPPPPPGGAGEYTRIIAAQAPPPLPASSAPQPSAPPTAAPEAASGTPTWMLVAGLILVLVIALALVLYIVLRPA